MSSSSPALRTRMLRAGSWSLLAHVVSLGLRMASSLITTRLLAPEMFGLMAMTTTVMTIAALLTDVGVRESLIQSRRGEETEFQNTAWTVQILRGVITWVGTGLIALGIFLANQAGWLPAESTYSHPLLPALICGIAFSSLISGFRSTKLFLANRRFEMGRSTQIELVTQFIGSVITILLAWWTHSVWSMVIGTLVSAVLGVALSQLYLTGPANRFAWDRDCLQELVRFGRWVAVSSAVTVFALNGDRLMLGGLVGPQVLGLYSIALMLAMAVDSAVMRLIAVVSFPALSEVARQAPERLPIILRKMRLPSDITMLLVAGLLFALGGDIVALLYDRRYHDAGRMLELLSFSMVFSRYSLMHQAYMALGQPKYNALINSVSVCSLFVLVPIGYQLWGIHGAVAGIALRYMPTLPLVFYANAKCRLNDFRFEVLVLLAWLGGFAIGELVHRLVPLLQGGSF